MLERDRCSGEEVNCIMVIYAKEECTFKSVERHVRLEGASEVRKFAVDAALLYH